MKKLWHFVGRVVFWMGWPFLYLYLFRSKRTRILVIHGSEVLVEKRWQGSGRWNLPGGGLHAGEKPAHGAARELKEETGLGVNATELQYLFSGASAAEKGFNFTVYAFVLKLSAKPEFSKQKFLLTHLEWTDWKKLYDDSKTDQSIRTIIDAWQRS